MWCLIEVTVFQISKFLNQKLKKYPEAPLWACGFVEVPQGTSMKFENQETIFNRKTTVIHESLLYLNPSNDFPNPYTGPQDLASLHLIPTRQPYLFDFLSYFITLLFISLPATLAS